MKMRPATEKRDGIVFIDQAFARKLGFTSEKFEKESYLWKKGKEIYTSFIASTTPQRGYFTSLVNNCLKLGYTVKVPCPLPGMNVVVRKLGFKESFEWDEKIGEDIDVWIKKPEQEASK